MTQARTRSTTPVEALAAFRRLVMTDTELRGRALRLVGGEARQLWLVTAAGGLALVSQATKVAGVADSPLTAALTENGHFTLAMAMFHLGVDPQAFYTGLGELLDLVQGKAVVQGAH